MSSEQRPLTKSLFKLALECPRKLDYASKPHEYFDASSQDAFLAKLAEGGYQVGELAKLMFPGGIDLSQLDQTEQLRLTRELLQRDCVVIFEAAIESEGLFARVDILHVFFFYFGLVRIYSSSFFFCVLFFVIYT